MASREGEPRRGIKRTRADVHVDRLVLTQPDDWHVHLRDGSALSDTVPATAHCFARAIVMPNLDPPIVTTQQALAYRERILAAVPASMNFEPLMTLYLTEETTPAEVRRAKESGSIYGIKLYPAGVTTHSAGGVREIARTYETLEALQDNGIPLLVHAESMDPEVDVFDAERVFIEQDLVPVVAQFPALRIVLEHVSTQEGVDYVMQAPATVAATITAHHLLLNRNALFAGGLRPHHFCRPLLKRERHRQALIAAATGGSPKFFIGSDSAPHPRSSKEAACGCAGVFTAYATTALYAEVFEAANALPRLEAFLSFNGPDFYGLARNSGVLCLEREPHAVPEEMALGDQVVVPLRAGDTVRWSITS